MSVEHNTSEQRLQEHPRVVGLFQVVRKMADGLYVIETGSARESAMWTLRKLRKTAHCAATRLILNKGESHYGPIGNMDYRSWRVHRQFFEERATWRVVP